MIYRHSSALLCVLLFPLVSPAQGTPTIELPEGAVTRLGDLRFSMHGAGMGLALSPSGTLAAVASGKGGIVIWDTDHAEVVYDYSSTQRMWPGALAWSANGRLIALVASKPEVQIWKVATGNPIWDGLSRKIGTTDRSVVSAVRFVADDRWLALVQTPLTRKDMHHPYEKTWQVDLWGVASGKLETTWSVDQSKLDALGKGYDTRQITLSPSGARMAWLASQPASVKDAKSAVFIHDTVSGKLLHTVKDLARAERIDLPDEGDTIVMHPLRPAKVDKIITVQAAVVNVADGRTRFQCAYRLRQKPWRDAWDRIGLGTVDIPKAALRFGDTLLLPDEVGMTRWDFKTGQKVEDYNEPFGTLVISANGKRIAVRDRRRFGVSDGPLASLRPAGAYADTPYIHYLRDGRLVGSDADNDRDGLLHVWSPRGKLLESRRLFSLPSSASDDYPQSWDSWRTTMVGEFFHNPWVFATFDAARCERLAFSQPMGGGKRARISGDGKRVLVYELEKQGVLLHWFDARTGRELGRKVIPLDRPLVPGAYDFAADWFAEDGSIFGFYRASERRLTLVSCATKEVVLQTGVNPSENPSGHRWDYHSMGFDRLIWARPISSSAEVPDKSVPEHLVWDRQGRMVRRFRTQVQVQRTSRPQMILSADGRLLAYYEYDGKTVVLVDTATGRPRGRVQVSADFVARAVLGKAAFSPDGVTLATSAQNSILLWNLARPLAGKAAWATPTSVKEAAALWEALGDPDPTESDRALWALVAAPEHTLELLKDRLRPAPGPDAKRVHVLVKQLDSANFKERDAANKALLALPPTALPVLRAVRKAAGALELQRRLDEVIAELQTRLEAPASFRSNLRELRALEVLERIGTAAARQQVAALAEDSEGAVMTFEAQLVLARWPVDIRLRSDSKQ